MYSAISHIRNSRAALSSFSSSASSLIRIHGGFSTFSPFSSRSPAPPEMKQKQENFPFSKGNFMAGVAGPNQEPNRNMKPWDIVRSVIDENDDHFTKHNKEGNEEVVHIKLLRNNTFVTVTDRKGNTKVGGLSASSGMVPELKGGPKLARYVAQATSEHVGRKSREMGLRSVVIKVNGFTFFKKKRQAIMSFKEGFGHDIAAIEDTTRKPHNGCRLPKKRRI